MRKMILGIMAFICALSTFAMDENEPEYSEPPPQQSLELGDNSQQRSWWELSESIKGSTINTLELIQSYLRNSKEAKDFEEVTFEKIPEDGAQTGTLYLQEAGSQLKCTGLITICENEIEKSYPISVFLFAPEGLTAESLKPIHLDHSNQIKSLFKHALETLQEEALREHINQAKVSPETPSHQEEVSLQTPSQEPVRTGWWSAGASLLTLSSWLRKPTDTSDSEVAFEEVERGGDDREHEAEQGQNLSTSSSMGGAPTQRSGLGSWSGWLAKSSEGEKESQNSEDPSGKREPTMSSLPNFPTTLMSADGIPFETRASDTDPLAPVESAREGTWRSVGGYLDYFNLGGYLGGRTEEVMIPLQEQDQKNNSMDVTDDDLKEWKVIGQEEKEQKYKTFLMSDLPGNGIPGENQIYVQKFHDKLQVKFTNFGEPMLAFPKSGEPLEEGKRYVGTKEPFNKPQILSVPSNPNLQVVTAILNINLSDQLLTLDLLNSIKPQIIGMLELENFIPKEMDEIPVVDNEKEEEKGEEEERRENQSTESSSSDEGGSFL